MGRTLFLYLMWRSFKLFLTLSVGIFALILMIDSVELLRKGMDQTLGGFGLIWLGARRTIVILQTVLPFIMLLTAIFSLIGLNRSRELVVIRAAGLSVWRFLMPLCVVAIMCGLLSSFVISPLAAWAQKTSNGDVAQSLANAPIASTTGPMKWIRQTDGKKTYLIGSRGQAAGFRFLGDVMIFELTEDSQIARRIDAREARFFSGAWQLRNVKIAQTGKADIEKENLSLQSNASPARLGANASDPALLSLFDIEEAKLVASEAGLSTSPYDQAWHSILARPFVFLIMVCFIYTWRYSTGWVLPARCHLLQQFGCL